MSRKRDPQKEFALLERRKRVAEGYLRRLPQWKIAQAEGVSRVQITRDLGVIRTEWLESSLMAFDQRQAEELARLDKLEAEAWEAWERSKRDQEILTAQTIKGRMGKTATKVYNADGSTTVTHASVQLPELSRTSKAVRTSAGDPKFLDRIAHCIEMRCKILGLLTKDDDSKTAGPVPIATFVIHAPPPVEQQANVLTVEHQPLAEGVNGTHEEGTNGDGEQ